MQLPAHDKEVLFSDLAGLLRTGMTFRLALEKIARHARRLRPTIRRMLLGGELPQECLRIAGTAFNDVDIAIVSAGAESGRMDEAFAALGDYYATVVECKRQFFRGLYYPVGVFHFGVLMLSLPLLFTGGGTTAYFREVLTILFVFYFLFIAIFLGFRLFQDFVQSNASLQRSVRHLPLLGRLPYQLSLWRFSLVGSMLTASGTGIFYALDTAARSTKNMLLREAVAQIVAATRDRGESLGEAFAKTGAFPEEMVRFVSLAESSGRLDEELNRSAKVMQRDFQSLVQVLAKFLPKLIYFAIVIFFMIRMLQLLFGVNAEMKGLLDL